jgi:hypothetical protein
VASSDGGDEAGDRDGTKVSHGKKRRITAQLLQELDKVVNPDTYIQC